MSDDRSVDRGEEGAMRGGLEHGASTVRFEPPDLCVSTFVGELCEAEARRICTELKRMFAGRPHALLLSDLSRLKSVSPEARRCIAEELKELNIRGSAAFGASFRVRVLATLTAKIQGFLGLRATYSIAFFESEAQARAWINERRKSLQR